MRRVLLGLSAFIVSCQCGGYNPCDMVHCKVGFTCDVKSGLCRQDASGGGAGAVGGGSTGGGSEATGGGAAVGGGMSSGGGGDACNCSGNTPYCLAGTTTCVQCITSFDCMGGQICDPGLNVCMSPGAGGGSAGTGGGTGGGGGNGTVVFDDAGMTAHCLQTGGPAPQCTTECNRGFVCVSGQCVLRGSTGPVQVTLRFNQPEDLDLHVVEPLPDAGTCEIWYGNPNQAPDAGGFPFPFFDAGFPFPFPGSMSCGAKGWLDLDSNPACRLDNVNIENVIYPAGSAAPSGTYIVRVDYYEACDGNPVPYEVEVRANGQTRYYCGMFQPSASDEGNEGSGVTVTTFTIP